MQPLSEQLRYVHDRPLIDGTGGGRRQPHFSMNLYRATEVISLGEFAVIQVERDQNRKKLHALSNILNLKSERSFV